jgi:DNA-binding FrmR family transcriptional regulator
MTDDIHAAYRQGFKCGLEIAVQALDAKDATLAAMIRALSQHIDECVPDAAAVEKKVKEARKLIRETRKSAKVIPYVRWHSRKLH